MKLSGKIIGLLSLVFCLLAPVALAVDYWQPLNSSELRRSDETLLVSARKGSHVFADINSLRQQLLFSNEFDIALPLPDGDFAVYHLEYSPIAAQALLDQFPDIRTFRGVDVNNAANKGRFDISPAGFRGMFRHNGKRVFIDPQYKDNEGVYIAYYAADAQPLSERPDDTVLGADLFYSLNKMGGSNAAKDGGSDGQLRTYRLAVATTGEYAQFFGGTVDGALAAITTAINRVNEVYENDLGIRLELIANNNLIIYTNPATDPYENDGFSDLNANQSNINTVIGASNYDIGHLFGTGAGGVAGLGVVCSNSAKARGLTGLNNPNSDVFYIDFVAHELGHQFGANHTFNGTSGSCGGGNRNSSTAVEPGSGSTIMAYAGICGVENLQTHSDAYFHAKSIQEITAFITNNSTGGSCGTRSISANSVPDVTAGVNVTIPANTPFLLNGSGNDSDARDILAYVWEQIDAGTAIFRSFSPTVLPVRYLPRLDDVLDGTTVIGESYPVTGRDLNFRLTVRDGSGASAFEDKTVTVSSSAGPFVVTAPSIGDLWSAATATVTWDVANTNASPVSCTSVDIYLSPDNEVFPYSLTTAPVPNTGSALVAVPLIDSSQSRVMVSCANNVFFNVNDGIFSISRLTVPVLSIVSDTATEGSALSFVVTLDSTLITPETYSFSIYNRTTNDADIGSISFPVGFVDNSNGTITVPAGISSFSVLLNTIPDSLVEGDEQVDFYLGGLSAEGAVLDDDVLVLTVSSDAVVEGESLVFDVELTASTSATQMFSYTLTAGAASASDYGSLAFDSGITDNGDSITVPSGVSSFQVTLPTNTDLVDENTEIVTLVVEGRSGYGSIINKSSSSTSSSSGSGGGSLGMMMFILLLSLLICERRVKA